MKLILLSFCLGWAVVILNGIVHSKWYHLGRKCGWCKKRMGGNPFARKISHGICPTCFQIMTKDLVKS